MNVALTTEERGAAKTAGKASISLLPTKPGSWAQYNLDDLLTLSRKDVEDVQLAALQYRFGYLKDGIQALDRLAKKQGVTRIDTVSDALPLFFDHRVHKSYPLSLIETRDFPKLTAWLNRLTMHDLLKVDLDGLTTLDDWLTRLDDYGMIVGHSTGTTGKLSFVPRSKVEWPAWQKSYHEAIRLATGVDPTKEFMPTFTPTYRGGHQMGQKMLMLFNLPAAGGDAEYHTLYQTRLSADLMSLAGRLQSAEDKGELEKLALDPVLLQKRQEMIEQGRRREQDIEAWFTKLIEQYRGRRVKIGGSYGDLTKFTLAGEARGLKCSFAPGSIIMSGAGMKGFKDAPPDWEDRIKKFFGIDKICSIYGMSECVGSSPCCSHEFYHIPPHIIPYILDADSKELPRTGVQTGRMVLFDLLAETYWGGVISGDQVTIHWDEDCACGWKGPRITRAITRFHEMAGGDDKITCAGSAEAYNEFMNYVMTV